MTKDCSLDCYLFQGKIRHHAYVQHTGNGQIRAYHVTKYCVLIKNQNIEADQWLTGPEGNVETDFKGVFMNLRNTGNGLSCDCGDSYMNAHSCQNANHTLKNACIYYR